MRSFGIALDADTVPVERHWVEIGPTFAAGA